MKLLLLTLLISSITMGQISMNIKNKDGTIQSIDISTIKKMMFSGVVSVEDGEKLTNIIKTFSLLKNYPNPFNPSTTIEYQIPKSGYIEINIYDINGQLIKNIEKRKKNAGNYKVNWNGNDNSGISVASGVYFYQVKFNNSFITKKMILLK